MLKSLKTTSFFLIFFAISTFPVNAKIVSETIKYQISGESFQGYISYDDDIIGKRPGILVVHEWWGHNAYARKRADMLAALGYTAFAIDMYGEGKLAEHPDDALTFMQAVMADNKISENRFNQAMQLLKKHPTIDPDKIAAIGYCFGGATVLHMAKKSSGLLGVVSFHGSLVSGTAFQETQIKPKVLVLNGEDDPFVSAQQIATFKQEMEAAQIDYQFVNYPGVKHSFTNPDADDYGQRFDMPLVYNKAADQDSWQRMQQFFNQLFM